MRKTLHFMRSITVQPVMEVTKCRKSLPGADMHGMTAGYIIYTEHGRTSAIY